MRRWVATCGVAAFIAIATAAYAQERPGAGRIEITGFPTGGMFFTSAANEREPYFGTYAVGGSFTYNLNRSIGFEGEIGNAVGVNQDLTFGDQVLNNQRSPSMYTYTGNVVFNPIGNDRGLVPYTTAGVGGITLVDNSETAAIGVTANTTYFAGNAGGGLKWYFHRYLGVRGDYRLIMVSDKSTAPEFFGQREVRYGHRVYGGLLFTY
jgi:outer membrane protein with beta-barrel domain